MNAPRGEQYRIDRSSGASVTNIQASAREAWEQMRIPGSVAHDNALARGIDPEKQPVDMYEAVKLKPAGAGAIGIETVVVIVTYKAAKDLWKYVLLPHIRDRWGDRALAAKKKAAKVSSAPVKKARTTKAAKSKAAAKKGSR